MSDIYQNVVNKYKGSSAIVVLFILSVVMLVIGANHFVEDTHSSYYGLQSLEQKYALNVQIFSWTYWTMSLAPQIASMVFFYMYLADTSKKWALYICLGSQFMDFFADTWYRSNGQFFDGLGVAGISSLLTFIYFSIGSEFFVSVGAGLIIKIAAPALSILSQSIDGVLKVFAGQQVSDKGDQDSNRQSATQNRPSLPIHQRGSQGRPAMPFRPQSPQKPQQGSGYKLEDFLKRTGLTVEDARERFADRQKFKDFASSKFHQISGQNMNEIHQDLMGNR